MDCSPPGSSVPGDKNTGVGCYVLPNPGIEFRCPALQADSLPVKPPGKPYVDLFAISIIALFLLVKSALLNLFCFFLFVCLFKRYIFASALSLRFLVFFPKLLFIFNLFSFLTLKLLF